MAMDSATLTYFSSINPLAKKVVNDTLLVEKLLEDEWRKLDFDAQDNAIDDFFVDPTVREKYHTSERENVYPECFPKLMIPSGEKIIVDDHNDFWTWQDEHSAPFSWRSKSQQDLSLSDLDDLAKQSATKSGKSKKTETTVVPSKPQFMFKPEESRWNSTFPERLKDITSSSLTRIITDDNKSEGDRERSQTPEEINYAFKGSNSDIHTNSVQESIQQINKKQSNGCINESPGKPSNQKNTKLSLSSSFSRKKQDYEQISEKNKESLPKSNSKEFTEVELNAFDNPVMSSNIDTLIQDEEGSSSSNSSPARKPLLKEPLRQTMDRDVVKYSLDNFPDDDGFSDSHLKVVDERKSSSENLNDSSIPISGFDFLDKW